MNSSTGSGSRRPPSSSSSAAVSFDSYRFDFGIGSDISSSSRPLNDQKLNPNTASSKPATSSYKPSPAIKPSWIHQPSTAVRSGLPNPPPSMAGDIFGRSWSSAVSSSANIGLQDKNPNMFGDLLGSVIGSSSSQVKNSSFSMADMKNSIPKTINPNSAGSFQNSKRSDLGKPQQSNVSSDYSFGSFQNSKRSDFGNPQQSNVSSDYSFGSFQNSKRSDFGKPQQSNVSSDYSFGGFQNSKMSDFGKPQRSNVSSDYSFGSFQNSKKSDFGKPQQSNVSSDYSFGGFQNSKRNDFGKTEPAVVESGPLDMHDWDVSSESGGTTTEIEGLPPPPTGVTSSAAKTKGLDSYKQGQFADAIKWLSWCLVLLEKAGNVASFNEVLICRASCYKEVGEYKKAIADCSKVLDQDSTNVSVLVQRALLYESSEKYRLGAEDLRAVLKVDPSNRLARSTIHRLNQFAD